MQRLEKLIISMKRIGKQFLHTDKEKNVKVIKA